MDKLRIDLKIINPQRKLIKLNNFSDKYNVLIDL